MSSEGSGITVLGEGSTLGGEVCRFDWGGPRGWSEVSIPLSVAMEG